MMDSPFKYETIGEGTDICLKHGEYKYVRKYLIDHEMVHFCPICAAEQRAKDEKWKAENNDRARLDQYRSEGIDEIFLDATFDNFVADTPELKKNVEAVKKLVRGEINTILMVGKNGTGKTHLAIAALKELNGAIYTMYEIVNIIRDTYGPSSERSELNVVDELLGKKLLIIDELGRTKGSGAETNWLSYIIDKRYARKMPLIIITNKHIMKDCPSHGCQDCVENYISEDIMSRLAANGLMLRFTGADYRKKVR